MQWCTIHNSHSESLPLLYALQIPFRKRATFSVQCISDSWGWTRKSLLRKLFFGSNRGSLLYHLTLWPTNFYCYYPSLISICLNSVKSFISVSQLSMYTSTHVLLENRAGVSWSPYSTDSYFHDFVFAFVICVSFMANTKAGNKKNTAGKFARPRKTVLVLVAWFQILLSQAS